MPHDLARRKIQHVIYNGATWVSCPQADVVTWADVVTRAVPS